MKVAIMGAGAVGSYIGGLLAAAGREVVLIGREAHVDAVNAEGLRISRGEEQETVRLAASTDPAAVADADVVLCCVKSTGTGEAAADLEPHLRGDTLVVSVQNGIGNAEVLADALPRARVIASVVYVAVGIVGPGHVRHHGAGELVVDSGADHDRLAQLFDGSGFAVRGVPDVRVALWGKLIANCVWNPLSAITGHTYGEVWSMAGMPQVVDDIAGECLAVGRAEGIDLPDTLVDDTVRLARTMPTQMSSTAQDLARGRLTEIDHLTGEIVRRGELLGVPTPTCRLLTALVHAKE
ncbi:ketopantoate reductase family protein [Mobilicoccus caccae]|uniref:2-dehydropantoate 2-reductase n=1 Tax=Mobilicoccus caccae TaxID=1859295 RepID=A0ABQ6IL62_9MICO|nr:2-dehydropantoate 2-reductase [Mobilicoccus caccae]GMA38196.1 2-dehydropantoate 2-reductase [Mobilicoccus caccae]